MKSLLNANDVLGNGPGSDFLLDTCRVLAVVEESDEVWLIDRPRLSRKEGKENQFEEYVRKPYLASLARVNTQLLDGQLVKLNFAVPSFLSDQDRLGTVDGDKELGKVQTDLEVRNRRFACIARIVCEPESSVLRPFLVVITDSILSQKIQTQAALNKVSPRHVYKTLHQFWAGGSIRHALGGGYDRCGNPGKEKPQRCHLGRKSKAFNAGLTASDGYHLSADCKRKMAYGYALIRQGVTVPDAYRMTMGAHWSTHTDDPSTGTTIAALFDRHLRPTIEQFENWGKKATQKSVTELLLGANKYRQGAISRGGSEQDLVVGVGQMSGFDATSTDVYLTRTSSRLKRLPPMTRSILKDIRTGVVYGLYCGWEGASPATALKTILHGADPDKKSWAARFGVDLPDGAMPAMLARQHLADNGELKAAEATEAECQFGFGVVFAPTRQGDRKGGVESQHKSDHAKLDHKLPGTTFGKPQERGQRAPVTEALWNYYEYMRELIFHVIEHNTRELVPELAPDAMLLVDPPIAPTRINIFNWLTEHGMNNSLPVDYDAMRAFCLPYVDAVVQKNGVFLMLEINGRKRMALRLRFTSPELVATGLLSEVKRTNKSRKTRVKLDHANPYQAWLPTKAGLIPMQSCPNDTVFRQKLPLAELVAMWEEMDLSIDSNRSAEDQFQLEKNVRRANVTSTAKEELRDEEAKSGGRTTNAALKRDLRANKAKEMDGIKRQQDQCSAPNIEDFANKACLQFVPEPIPDGNLTSMADILMERHNARRECS